MRCLACNHRLTEEESTQVDAITGEYLDLCKHCIGLSDDLHFVDGIVGALNMDDPDGEE